jgi:hypothetical protein
MSTESNLATAIAQRLALITTGNGYNTDIGTHLFKGKLKLDVSEFPAVILVEGETRVEAGGIQKAKVVQRYIIEGHDTCDADQPNEKAYEILADLKRAIFTGDITFGGIVRPQDLVYVGRRIGVREDGAAVIAASIEIDCKFAENLTDP